MSDLFNEIETEETNEDDLLNALKSRFGDGENFDIEKLARAKLESDRHIAKLEREAAERQTELAKQSTMDEILTRIREASTPQSPTPQAHQPSGSDTDKQSPNVEEVVANILAQRESTERLAKNRQKVQEGLTKAWGADASRELNKKARELGVTLEELKKQGDSNPALLFRILGVDPDYRPEAPRGAVAPKPSPQSLPKTGVRDKAYYDRLKASNRSEYFSQKVQNQMYKDWLAHPELFN